MKTVSRRWSLRTLHRRTSAGSRSQWLDRARILLEATASHHGVDRLQYAVFRSAAPGRDMAAWLCRRRTGVTFRKLGPAFGLTGTDSVSNLVRRAQQQSKRSAIWRKRASEIEAMLQLNTENKV